MGRAISVFIPNNRFLSLSECIVFVSCLAEGGVNFSCFIFAVVLCIVLGETSASDFGTALGDSDLVREDLDFLGTPSGDKNCDDEEDFFEPEPAESGLGAGTFALGWGSEEAVECPWLEDKAGWLGYLGGSKDWPK